MHSISRERAMRLLLAALINSSMSADQLRQLAEEIRLSDKFASDFANLLQYVAEQVRTPSNQKNQKQSGQIDRESLNMALVSIKRRRLSKKEIIDIITSVAPDFKEQGKKEDVKTRDIVAKFLAIASAEQRTHFLDLISRKGEGPSDDPYLRGIVGKR